MDFRVCVNEYNKNGISFIYNVLVYRYQNSEECDSTSFKSILDSKNISQYWLSKLCKISYTTINDIYNQRTELTHCLAKTVYKIAKALDLTVEYLIEDTLRCDFELFKSNVCYKLKELTDINFIVEVLESNQVRI